MVSTELQELIEREKLIQDAMKLERYRTNTKTVKKINKIRDELADETNELGELDYIYRFAEMLKERIR